MDILITGATGLLGKSLIETTNNAYNLTGIYLGRYRMPEARNLKYCIVDIQEKEELARIFDRKGIDIVIHTAGIADVDFCERNYELAFRSNIMGTQNIIELCKEKNARFVYISTNAVFDGRNPPYKEEDRTNPVNRYGSIKLECEQLVKAAFSEYLIIRPMLMYGWNNPNERKNLVTFLLENLTRGKGVNIVNDVYENPLFSNHCARVIWLLIERAKYGTYHVAGKDIASRYNYALAIAETFGLDKKLINPVESSFFPDIAPRPKNTSYDTSKLERELNFLPLGLKEGLTMMKCQKEASYAEKS